MTASPRRRPFTVDDYHRMAEAGILGEDDRVELIEGEIIDMAPIGSTRSGTINRLIRLFNLAIDEAALLSIHNPVVLDMHSESQPDPALLRPREDFYTNSHPRPEDVLLLVEVCESSLRYDRERSSFPSMLGMAAWRHGCSIWSTNN